MSNLFVTSRESRKRHHTIQYVRIALLDEAKITWQDAQQNS